MTLSLLPKSSLARYLYVSVSVYAYIFIGIYLLVNLFSLPEFSSYILIYGIAYILDYTFTLFFVFRRKHDFSKLIKYLIYIISFFFINALLYKIALNLGINYLLSVVLVAGILMPLRFLVNKYWVYG